MKKVLEIEIKEINEEYSAWWVSYQNEEMLPRGEFRDEELKVYSFDKPLFSKITDNLYILGRYKKEDLMPCVIKNSNIALLKEKINKINEKYGRKTENSGVDREELKPSIIGIYGVAGELFFNFDNIADKEMKNKLTRIKDMLEYILEAFEKAKKG